VKKSIYLLALLALLPGSLAAQRGEGAPIDARGASRRVVRAAPLAGEIKIDGRLDEAAWAAAEPTGDFTQSWPREGQPATFRTEARVLLGADALYVGVRMFDPHPDSIAAPLARRDAGGIYSDWIHLIIDSRMDRRTAFRFSVNPRGVQRDVYTFDDGNEDGSWDAVWQVATAIDSLGWTAEYRIPLSQLRFATGEDASTVWGLGLMRDVARLDERTTWSPWSRNTPGFVSRFGDLAGMEGLRAPRRLELMPYASSQLTREPGDRANPFYSANATAGAVGVDLKAGLPLGLTLSATINPDFGQVELDPAQVNLSAFETFFSEKRPFFTEGSDVFGFGRLRSFSNYGSQEYFYSRRVGRAPRRQLSGSGFVDAPVQTTILGAAKVSGRTPGGWSVGLMNALTAREEARYVDGAGKELKAQVEPLTNYTVGRVRRDLRGGQTVVGALATATARQLSDTAFLPLAHERAYLGGVDFDHRWNRGVWSLGGFLAGTRVEGDARAISSTQRTSGRYFQRPDADYLEYDPTRTSLGGHIGSLALARSGEGGPEFSLSYKESSPGFELNDAGFQGRTDYRAFNTLLARPVNKPKGVLRNHNIFGYTYHVWNFGGDPILAGYSLAANGTFTNLWSAEVRAQYRPDVMDDRLTRGGPIASAPSQWVFEGSVQSDRRKLVSAGLGLSSTSDEMGGYSRSVDLSFDVRPSSALRLRAGPNFGTLRSMRQYVTSAADAQATQTFGRRYIFAELEQTTLALETRVDWTFTPQLSLQLYAQPYVSAGSYSNFKAFRTPGTLDFERYGACSATPAAGASTICRTESADGARYVADADGAGPAPGIGFRDPDFTFRSLRGNAVLRWEYRPGSAVFFVWQQERASQIGRGDFDFSRDYGALFREPARNIFLVKATYWIGK
jgi:hypothetical protein